MKVPICVNINILICLLYLTFSQHKEPREVNMFVDFFLHEVSTSFFPLPHCILSLGIKVKLRGTT